MVHNLNLVKAEVCPKCGVKVKKPLYKKTWFIVLAVIAVIAAVASSGGGDEKEPSGTSGSTNTEAVETVKETVYEEYTVSQLIDDLDSNALKAENTYDGKNVKLTGKVSVIDSDGDYVSLEPSDNPYSFTNVQCYLKEEAQLQTVMELSIGQTVTVYGEITRVGEIMGYSLDIHKIEY